MSVSDIGVQTIIGWFILYTVSFMVVAALWWRTNRQLKIVRESHKRVSKTLHDTDTELTNTKTKLFTLERIANKFLAKDAYGTYAGPGQQAYVPIDGKVLTGVVTVAKEHGHVWMIEVADDWLFEVQRGYINKHRADTEARKQMDKASGNEVADPEDSGK